MRLAELPDDVEYSWEVKKYKKPRSLPQNAYLHAVLIPCFRDALYEAGWDEVKTDLDAKKIMKELFLRASKVNKETGELLEYVRDTSELNVEEMNILYEDVWRFCAETFHYKIPRPNEQGEMFIDNK